MQFLVASADMAAQKRGPFPLNPAGFRPDNLDADEIAGEQRVDVSSDRDIEPLSLGEVLILPDQSSDCPAKVLEQTGRRHSVSRKVQHNLERIDVRVPFPKPVGVS